MKKNAKFEVSLGYTSGGGREVPTPTLRVVDSHSGKGIVEFDLTPEQFTKMLGSHYLSDVEGWLLPAEHRVHLGKRSEHETRAVPEGVGAGWSRAWTEGDETSLKNWASQVALNEGWDEWRDTRRSQGSLKVHFTRYVAVESEGERS